MKPGHYALLLPAMWIAAFVFALGCEGELHRPLPADSWKQADAGTDATDAAPTCDLLPPTPCTSDDSSAPVAASHDGTADTVTEKSALIYTDNLSGCYRWTWTDGSGRRSASPPNVCGYDLYLHIMSYNTPTGTITGSTYWFPGPFGQQTVVPIQQSTSWSSSAAYWWEQDPYQGTWYWNACNHRNATSYQAAGWDCGLWEEDPYQAGHMLVAGTRVLTLVYGHAGN